MHSTAEYCAPVFCRSANTCLIDPAINDALQIVTGCLCPTPVDNLPIIGVRGGGRGGGRPQSLTNFRANSVFRARAMVAQKSWMIKKYFNTVKNSKATVFQGKRKCSNILNDKKYIFNTVKIPGQLFFSGQAQVAQKS